MKRNFELRQLRDFGQVFNDSFSFFKDNFKPLMRSLFVICGAFLVIGTISTSATYLNMSSMFNYTAGLNTYSNEKHTISYLVSVFVTAFIALLTQGCISLVTMCYIAIYLQNKKQAPTVAQVWVYFKYYFWRIFGSSILLGMLTGIGFVFCIIPGVYLGIVFCLVMPIIVMENAAFGYAFNKSFKLISGNWWFIFGVLVVMSLILMVINSAAGMPMAIIPIMGKFLSNSANITMPLIIFFAVIRNLFMVSYCLIVIALALCYFDLSEQKEGTGLLARIENFGKAEPEEETETPGQLPAEEY